VSPETDRLSRAFHIATALVTFWLVTSVIKPFGTSSLLGPLLDLALGVAVGIAIPIFVFGKPTVRLEWKVEDAKPHPGPYLLDLTRKDEANFIVDVTAQNRSLLGFLLMKRAVRLRTTIVVRMAPHDVLRLKPQTCTAGARVSRTAGEIRVPLSTPRGRQKARASGAFIPHALSSGSDEVEVVAEACQTNQLSKTRWFTVYSPIPSISVRS
jgi:hypothetical protein